MNGELTTVYKVRSQYLAAEQTTDDAMLYGFCRQVTNEIQNSANRRFIPWIETQYYDMPGSAWGDLLLDDDLLSLTSIVNGNTLALSATQFKLYPLNRPAKRKVRLEVNSGVSWLPSSGGYILGAIDVTGVWGFHRDYSTAWELSGATLAAAINASVTSFTCQTGVIHSGDLLEVDTEWLYVTAVAVSTSDTVTVIRGANGSTAASHLITAPIYRYAPDSAVAELATQCAAGYYQLRKNPNMETTTIDGQVFSTPKDIAAHIRKRLEALSLINLGIG